MIPSSDRYARCEAASHEVNRLPVVERVFDDPRYVARLKGFADGDTMADWPLTLGAAKVLYKKLGEIILD